MLLKADLDRVRANVQAAATADLLDRATVFRYDMEPEAVDIIEAELQKRGIGLDHLEEHALRRECEVIRRPDGSAARCSFCRAPATSQGWGWHRVWGKIPLFPRFFSYCHQHRR